LWTGLVVLNLVVVGGITATVSTRARRDAREALRESLRLRAKTMCGLLERDRDGHGFDLPPRAMPEYMTPKSGAYAAMYDASGKPVARSPSLAGKDLRFPAPWSDGAFQFSEIEDGPDGIPCEVVTHSFVVHVEDEKGKYGAWTPPTDEQRRYQVVVAADTRPRDAALASLETFLAITAASAIVATALGGFVLARLVLSPIRRMTREAAELDAGHPSRRLKPETVVRELASLGGTLNSAFDRLRDALDRQRRFTSDASHELRTPLAGLAGNAELLLRRERTAQEYRTGLARQMRIARRMTRITENLLTLARSDDGRARIERVRVDAAELTRRVCDEFEATAQESGVRLKCSADSALEIDADPACYEAVVQNLVANAVKFTPQGGSVDVTLARDGHDAILTVTDTGAGIPPAELAHVFERFFRVSQGRDRREGAGLGLAIVDWIVREHGGRVDVKSEVGRGTHFEVRMPLADGVAPTP
jgi:heavy metal sensor kinase